jgi:integrase
MNVQQKFKLLIFPKWNKASGDGEAPIYVRIKIDGDEDEISLGCKITEEGWDPDKKRAKSTFPLYATINKKIDRALVDLGRHFDLIQAKDGTATPSAVKTSYMALPVAQQTRNQKVANLEFNQAVDGLIGQMLAYYKKCEKADELRDGPTPEMTVLMRAEKAEIGESLKELVKAHQRIFSDPNRKKTFILTLNDYFVSFMQQVFAGTRSPTTLEKNMSRKRRYIEFFRFQYKTEDLALSDLRFEFAESFKNYNLVHHGLREISAAKLVRFFKEIVERAVTKGWLNASVYRLYRCEYKEPEPDWLTMEEMVTLKDWVFKEDRLGEIRDIFIFGSFTGLSYQEIRTLRPADIRTIDGKRWISKTRRKTDNEEALPLLPLAAQLLEKYADHPTCLRTGRLLPMPTNQEYNRRLKDLMKETGITNINLRSHKSRYFFANEVTYNNGVPLRTVGKMLSHGSEATTRRYVRPNKRHISSSMADVEAKLFNENGQLKVGTEQAVFQQPATSPESAGARIVQMGRR